MVLTEDQLRRIRDPERDTSVGRIGETPEEAEARQEEAYNRGAARGDTGGFHETEGPNRPASDSPAQIAAEREYVEKTLNRSNSDLLEKAADKTAVIDQIRARINEAGDKFASFNVTGRANEIIGELNKAAEEQNKQITFDDEVQVSQLAAEQKAGGWGISTEAGDIGFSMGLMTDKSGQTVSSMRVDDIMPAIQPFGMSTETGEMIFTPEISGGLIQSFIPYSSQVKSTVFGADIDSFISLGSPQAALALELAKRPVTEYNLFAKESIKLVGGFAVSPLYIGTELIKSLNEKEQSKMFAPIAISLIGGGIAGYGTAAFKGITILPKVLAGKEQLSDISDIVAAASLPLMFSGGGKAVKSTSMAETGFSKVKFEPSNRPLFGEGGLYPKSEQVVKVDNVFSNKDLLAGNKIDTAAGKQFDLAVKSKITELSTEIMANKPVKFTDVPAEPKIRPVASIPELKIDNVFSNKDLLSGNKIDTAAGKQFDIAIKSKVAELTTEIGTGKPVKFTDVKKAEPLEIWKIEQPYGNVKKSGFSMFADLPKNQVEKLVLDIETDLKISGKQDIKPSNKMPENPKLIEWKPKPTEAKGTPVITGKGLLTLQKTKEAVKPQIKLGTMQLQKQVTTPKTRLKISALTKQDYMAPKVGRSFSIRPFITLGSASKSMGLMGQSGYQKSMTKPINIRISMPFSTQLSKQRTKSTIRQMQISITKMKQTGTKPFVTTGQKPFVTTTQIGKPIQTTMTKTMLVPELAGSFAFATEIPRYRKKGKRGKRGGIGGINFFGFPRATLREVNISDIRFGRSTQPPKTKSIFKAWKRGLGLSVSTKELLRGDRKRKV